MPAIAQARQHNIAASLVILALDIPSAISRILGQKPAATTLAAAPTRTILVPIAQNTAVSFIFAERIKSMRAGLTDAFCQAIILRKT